MRPEILQRPPSFIANFDSSTAMVRATALLRDGRLVVLPGASHTITNTRPDQLVDIALPFLLGGEPGGGRPA